MAFMNYLNLMGKDYEALKGPQHHIVGCYSREINIARCYNLCRRTMTKSSSSFLLVVVGHPEYAQLYDR